MTATVTKKVLEINAGLLKKHFDVFRSPDKPLSIGADKAIKKYLEERHPGHVAQADDISKFLAVWVNQAVYMEAVKLSREKSIDGKAVRYTIFGNVVDPTRKHKKKATQVAKTKPPETPQATPQAESDLSFRGRPILRLKKVTKVS